MQKAGSQISGSTPTKKKALSTMKAKMPEPQQAPVGTSPGAPITTNAPAIVKKTQFNRM